MLIPRVSVDLLITSLVSGIKNVLRSITEPLIMRRIEQL